MIENTYLTPREAAEVLAVSDVTMRRWIRSGTIRAVRLPGGRGYRIRRDDLEAALEVVAPPKKRKKTKGIRKK